MFSKLCPNGNKIKFCYIVDLFNMHLMSNLTIVSKQAAARQADVIERSDRIISLQVALYKSVLS